MDEIGDTLVQTEQGVSGNGNNHQWTQTMHGE